MALKPGRHEQATDISYFMNETAERGGVVFAKTAGSGEALDQSASLCTYITSSGDRPLGMLMCDMVNIDQTRQHINWQKDEVQKGGKVVIMTRGWAVSNNLSSGTVSPSQPAYANLTPATSGFNLTPVKHATGGLVARPHVGEFMSKIDEDGYCKVFINLPQLNV